MCNDLLDLTPLLKIRKRLARKRSVDLQTINKDGDGDETVGLDIFVETVGGRLVEDDGVLCLVLDYWKFMLVYLLVAI